MKHHFTFIVVALFFCNLSTYGQSADLDKEYFKSAYVDLPTHPVLEDQKRTYTSNTGALEISGFSRISSGATIDFYLEFFSTKIGEVDIKKNTHVEKDKDGNVTSTTYTYNAITSYSTSANLAIINLDNKSLSKTKGYSESSSYESKSFSSSYKASQYYNNNKYSLRDEYRSNQKSTLIRRFNSYLNNTYGYVPITNEYSFFWILGSKKHPEFTKHHEAYDKLKVIFDKITYDKPIDALREEARPIIAYFNEIPAKFPGKKRKLRKVRYASYYNIAQIYYALEQPEKVKEYAQKIIDNDYGTKDGKRFTKKADQLINSLETNKIKTRHFEVITEDLSNQPEEVEVIEVQAADESERIVAFLITAKNDTISSHISELEIKRMSIQAALEMTGDDGKTDRQLIDASSTKKIVLANGDQFSVIKFKGSAKTVSSKFVKNVFEGEKVQLFVHKNKELVLKFTNDENGISTSEKDFIFGFNKKLAGFCTNCNTLKAKVNKSTYKNKEADLVAFCEAFEACE